MSRDPRPAPFGLGRVSSRRRFLGMVAALAAVPALAACTAAPAATPVPPTMAPATESTVAPAAPTAAPAEATAVPTAAPATTGQAAEVRFATDWTDGSRGETIKVALPLFEEKNPTIKVKLEPIGGDYWDKLQVQFSGGTVADVILFDGGLAPAYIEEGLIADLLPVLKAQNIDQSRWRPGPPPIFEQEGKLYAMPFQMVTSNWWYNHTMFEKAGIPTPDDTWDWAKVLEAAKELTNAPETYGLWINNDIQFQYGAMGIANGGVHWTNPEATKTLLDQPAYVDAITWNIEAVHKHKVAPLSSEVQALAGDVGFLFATGKIGMVGSAGSLAGFLPVLAGDRFEWNVMPTPLAPRTKQRGGYWNDQPHVVSSNAEKRGVLEQSFTLTLFLSSDEVQTIIAKDRGSTPVIEAIQKSETYLKPPPKSMQVIVDEIPQKTAPLIFPGWLEWFQTLNKEYEVGLIGERSIEDTIKAMVTEGDKVLAANKT